MNFTAKKMSNKEESYIGNYKPGVRIDDTNQEQDLKVLENKRHQVFLRLAQRHQREQSNKKKTSEEKESEDLLIQQFWDKFNEYSKGMAYFMIFFGQ